MPTSIRFFAHNRWNSDLATIGSSGERIDHRARLTKTFALAETWRSTGLANAYISADLGVSFRVGAVCLVKPNLTPLSLLRVRCGDDPSFAVVDYDSGMVARKRYYSDDEVTVAKTSEFFQNGLPISDVQKRIQRQIIVIELPTEVTSRHVRVDFVDPTNPDGYIEVAYVYAGIVLRPDRDVLFNWRMQRDDFVRDGQAACGQYWSSSVYNKTLMTLTMSPQRESDLTGYWLLLESLVSINCEFIVSITNRSDALEYITTVFGRWVQVPVNQSLAFLSYSIPMQIEEIVD